MKRTKLKDAKVDHLRTFHWVEYFKYNNAHLLKLDFNSRSELSAEERKLIAPSIRAFQIGEGSDGKHLSKAVRKFAMQTGYKEYPEIMRWFVMEENRHSQTLKKSMEVHRIPTVSKLWIDDAFRMLRKLMGLECEVIILVTAEMIALSYYTALGNATNSPLLKTICKQMLNDELMHVILQSDTLFRISKTRCKPLNEFIRILRKVIMRITLMVVWAKYKDLFLKGGYTYPILKKHCLEYLDESIAIEKTGRI